MPTSLKNQFTPEENSNRPTSTLLNNHPNTENSFADITTNSFGSSNTNINPAKPKKKIALGKIFTLFIILISLVLLSFGSYFAYTLASINSKSLGQGEDGNLLDQTKELFGSLMNANKRTELKGERDGRTNFLLLGLAPQGGTDTIILTSLYYSEKKVVTVNIPRDTLAFDGYETQKINGVYVTAEGRNNGKKNGLKKGVAGSEALVSLVSKEFSIPIHYWAKVSFNGAKQVVDEIGGVEIDVENNFTDYQYPTDDYNGYMRPAPSFKAGKQKMNGKTALIYSRSRHSGDNGEGSDFARSKRQSKLVQGIVETAKSKNLFENITKINNYFNIIGDNLQTSLTAPEIYSLYQFSKELDLKSNYYTTVWSTGNGFLCTGPNPEINYVITYCGGAVFGKNQVSTSRTKAKNQIQNLLQSAQEGELYSADVLLLGNQSTDIYKVQREFEKVGFTNVKLNNAYKPAIQAKKGTSETTTLYILDPKLEGLYKNAKTKPGVNLEIKTILPADKSLPKGSENYKIVAWNE